MALLVWGIVSEFIYIYIKISNFRYIEIPIYRNIEISNVFCPHPLASRIFYADTTAVVLHQSFDVPVSNIEAVSISYFVIDIDIDIDTDIQH